MTDPSPHHPKSLFSHLDSTQSRRAVAVSPMTIAEGASYNLPNKDVEKGENWNTSRFISDVGIKIFLNGPTRLMI